MSEENTYIWNDSCEVLKVLIESDNFLQGFINLGLHEFSSLQCGNC